MMSLKRWLCFHLWWRRKRIVFVTRSSGKNQSPTFLRYDTDITENDASNISIVACAFVAAVTFLPSRFLATTGIYKCIHTDWWVPSLCDLVVRVPGYRSRDPGFDSRRCQIFWEVMGLEMGPLSLVRLIEELLEWKSSGSGQEKRIKGRADPLRRPRDILYPQKLATTSPTRGSRSVGIVRLQTKGNGV
jgi:hypothetical protein